MSALPLITEPLIARASERRREIFEAAGQTYENDVATGKFGTDAQAVSVHTGIPIITLRRIASMIEDAFGGETDSDEFSIAVGGALESLLLGWLIRDEQSKVPIDPPNVCDAGQAALRAAGHKFCPECGIVRALHRDFSDGDED